jgi:hypothetical protein
MHQCLTVRLRTSVAALEPHKAVVSALGTSIGFAFEDIYKVSAQEAHKVCKTLFSLKYVLELSPETSFKNLSSD